MLSARDDRLHSRFWVALLTCSSILCIQGCVAPIAAVGASGSAAASSVGTAAAGTAAAYPVTATSLASSAVTGKSPLEHAASAATKKECNFMNIVGPKPICEEVVLPKIIDNSSPLPGPQEKIKETAKQ